MSFIIPKKFVITTQKIRKLPDYHLSSAPFIQSDCFVKNDARD